MDCVCSTHVPSSICLLQTPYSSSGINWKPTGCTPGLGTGICWTMSWFVKSIGKLCFSLELCVDCPLANSPTSSQAQAEKRLNVKACQVSSVQKELHQSVAENLATIPNIDFSSIRDTATLTDDWASISNCLKEDSLETLGLSDKTVSYTHLTLPTNREV